MRDSLAATTRLHFSLMMYVAYINMEIDAALSTLEVVRAVLM